MRVKIAEHGVGISDRGFSPAQPIAGRTRRRTATARTDTQRSARVQPRDAAAAGADFGDVNGGNPNWMTAAAGMTHATTDGVFQRDEWLAILDQRALGGGATH